MRSYKLACVMALLASCGGGSETPDGGLDAPRPDAPESAPVITSFVPTPSTVTAGVPTDVTWTWTYAYEPTIPEPACSIDNGVGPVTRGQATSVTLTSVTTFTLTCTSRAGTAMRQVVVAVPPVAPLIASFTATPTTVGIGAATDVTWSWTYANTPSPAPTCTIEHGVGTVTPGTTSSVTLTQARTYRLRCSNPQGAATAETTVSIDECAAGTHDCQANATCVDTAEGFTCQCNNGFTGNGDTCNAQVSCGVTPTLCDANASCVNGTSCACNAGYVGDGTTCERLRLSFVTSTTGSGNLSVWAGAGGNTGLAAADAICQARATAAGLPGTYVAWMSDSLSDAYCRVHGLTGKKAAMCGQGALPVSAGPWVRPDGKAFAPSIERLLAPTRAVFYPASLTESGVEVGSTDRVYTGTDDNGVLTSAACNDWTSSSSLVQGAMGEVNGGGVSWTDQGASDPGCNQIGRLRCVETTPGPALPSRHPVAKKMFLTSVSGTGNLSSWADAGGATGVTAGDAICQARARFAGYANPQRFKAWLSYSFTSATSRITTNGPWARPDGVVVATSEADLVDGRLAASPYLTETTLYAPGAVDAGNVWTGTTAYGSYTSYHCSSWSSASYTATIGRHDLSDARWSQATTMSCAADNRLVCLED